MKDINEMAQACADTLVRDHCEDMEPTDRVSLQADIETALIDAIELGRGLGRWSAEREKRR